MVTSNGLTTRRYLFPGGCGRIGITGFL